MGGRVNNAFHWEQRHGVHWLRWQPPGLPARVHAFVSSRLGGVSGGRFASLNLSDRVGDDPAHVAENRRRFWRATGLAERPGPLHQLQQVHGRLVIDVDREPAAERGDGLATMQSRRWLGTRHADCAPVFLADDAGRFVAVVHAGWRGTTAKIAAEAVRVAQARGIEPKRLWAGIGPAIGPCCYEVDPPVLERLHDAFGDQAAQLVKVTRPGYAQLDLVAANRLALLEAGVPAERITCAGVCTCCEQDRFFSYRGAGRVPCGQMLAVIGLDEP